jgi:hypothetical protein
MKHAPQVTKHVPKVDMDGFTEVTTKKSANKKGVHLKNQKPRFEYRPTLIRRNEMGESSKSMQCDPAEKAPVKEQVKNSNTIPMSNPFDVLEGEEDRVIELDDLASFAATLNGGVETRRLGKENLSSKGASTPSIKVSNV